MVAALFAYLNQRFLRLPATIGLMTLTLLSSLGLVGLGRLGVPAVLQMVEVVRTIDFYTVPVQYMLSFLLFTGALQLDTRSLGLQRMPVLLLATIGTVISTLWWLVPGAAGAGHAAGLSFTACCLASSSRSPTR